MYDVNTPSLSPQIPAAPRFLERFPRVDNVLSYGAILYVALGSLFLAATGMDLTIVLNAITQAFMFAGEVAEGTVPMWLFATMGAIVLAIRPLRQTLMERLIPTVAAVVYCSAFTVTFSLVKGNMPIVAPFWADGMFTRLDEILHFGQAPHALFGWLSGFDTSRLSQFYLNSWVFWATFFPVFVTALDPNPARRRQFIALWMAAWVLIGNVFAIVFLSYGPIFADLFNEGLAAAHAGPLALFERADSTLLLQVKERLWTAYALDDEMIGSGISAFPSVHVAMATVFGLYIFRISQAAASQEFMHRHFAAAVRIVPVVGAALGLGYLLTYFSLSVYLGWHYAVDGYASVAIIAAVAHALKRREERAAV